MKKFNFDVAIEAQSEEEATEKLTAAIVLMQKLKVNEIKKLSDIVKNDPVKTQMAKRALGL